MNTPRTLVPLFFFFLFPVMIAIGQGPETPISNFEYYDSLLNLGYTDSLLVTTEIISKGELYLPELDAMLSLKNPEKAPGSTYPLNIFLALGSIATDQAIAVAKTHRDQWPKYSDWTVRSIYAKRKNKTSQIGVFWQSSQPLRESPNEGSKIVGNIGTGDLVVIVRKIENPKELGPRGQTQTYLQIEDMDTEKSGYLQLLGFDFTPIL
jgi:hypothetical protein